MHNAGIPHQNELLIHLKSTHLADAVEEVAKSLNISDSGLAWQVLLDSVYVSVNYKVHINEVVNYTDYGMTVEEFRKAIWPLVDTLENRVIKAIHIVIPPYFIEFGGITSLSGDELLITLRKVGF